MEDEIQVFVEKLQSFHASLDPQEQRMLEVVLDAAEQGADTSGYLMQNLYHAEVNSRTYIEDRVKEAEYQRALSVSHDEAPNEGGPTADSRVRGAFDWLYSWLPRAWQHAP